MKEKFQSSLISILLFLLYLSHSVQTHAYLFLLIINSGAFFLLFILILDLATKQICILLKLPFPFICSSKYVYEFVFFCLNNIALPACSTGIELSFPRHSVTGKVKTQVSANQVRCVTWLC